MRILFVTPSYPPMIGGAERYAQALACELTRREHHVMVVTGDARSQKDFWQSSDKIMIGFSSFEDGVQVIRCPSTGITGGRLTLLAWRKAMTLISLCPGDTSPLLMHMSRLIPSMPTLENTLYHLPDYDLVHTFNISWEFPIMAAWRFAQSRDLPFAVTPFIHFGTEDRDRIVRNNTMDHQLRILREADAVLTLTSTERRKLTTYGVSSDRVWVVGGGVSPVLSEKEEMGSKVLERYCLSAPFILFIGRVSRDKGATVAVEAVLSLHRRGYDVTLVLAGQMTSSFEHYYRALQDVEKRIIRPLGLVDEKSKHALLEASSMLILPSRVESFGIVLLEAWAHGKPVIAARAGGLPDVVEEGEDGLLVPYGNATALADAMSRLLNDESLAKCMGCRGRRKLSACYSWRKICDRMLEIYKGILGKVDRNP